MTATLLPLAREDSRLGFHSEAEAHQYHPAKLEWRLGELKGTHEQIAKIVAAVESGEPYPESDFERNAPSCRSGGGWTEMRDGSRFRVRDEKNGDMWKNTTTPDGYYVGIDGVMEGSATDSNALKRPGEEW